MNKTTLIETLRTERRQWDGLLAQIGEERMQQPGVAGVWSVRDVIAHVMWYERETVGVLQQRAFVGSPLWGVSLDERNAGTVAESQQLPLQELRAEAQQVFEQLIQAIQTFSDAELNDASSLRDIPFTWLPWLVIVSNSYGHYHQHTPSLRAWIAAKSV